MFKEESYYGSNLLKVEDITMLRKEGYEICVDYKDDLSWQKSKKLTSLWKQYNKLPSVFEYEYMADFYTDNDIERLEEKYGKRNM